MSERADAYLTLAGPGTADQTISRSSFLAAAIPAGSEDTARALVADQRRLHHTAHHICCAWRLGCGAELKEHRHDDGEPPGSAGEPILKAIRGADLTDTVVIVARHFGGIKLGTGGLARAYGSTAAMALTAAPRRTVLLGRRGRLEFAYSLRDILASLLEAHGGRIEQERYTTTVRWRVWLPGSAWESFHREVVEASSGRVKIHAAHGPPRRIAD